MRAYHVLLPPGTRLPCRFEAMLAKEGGFGNKAAALYAQLDKDGDGQLTAEELKQVRQHSPVGLSRGPPPWASPVGLSRGSLPWASPWERLVDGACGRIPAHPKSNPKELPNPSSRVSRHPH